MTWGKCVIISLGLMLMTHVAQARDIDSFTDSQGTLHITNLGSQKPGSPANSPGPAARFRPGSSPGDATDLGSAPSTRPAHLPNPAASLPPGNLPGKTPVTPPVRALAPAAQAPAASLQPGNLPGKTPVTLPGLELAPAVQAPGPLAKAAPAEPVSADPRPGPVPAVAIAGGPAARSTGQPGARFKRGHAGGRPDRGAGRAGEARPGPPGPLSSGYPGPRPSRSRRPPTAALSCTGTVRGLCISPMCRWRSPLPPGR